LPPSFSSVAPNAVKRTPAGFSAPAYAANQTIAGGHVVTMTNGSAPAPTRRVEPTVRGHLAQAADRPGGRILASCNMRLRHWHSS